MSVIEKSYAGFIDCLKQGTTTLFIKQIPSRVPGKPSTLCNIQEVVNGVPKDIYFLVPDRKKDRELQLASSGTTAGQNWTVNETSVVDGLPGVPDLKDGSDVVYNAHEVMKLLFQAVCKEYNLGKHFELRYSVKTKEGEDLVFYELPSNTFKGVEKKKAYSFADHLNRPGNMTYRIKYAIINHADASDSKGEKNTDYVFFRLQLGLTNYDKDAPPSTLRKRVAAAPVDTARLSKPPKIEEDRLAA